MEAIDRTAVFPVRHPRLFRLIVSVVYSCVGPAFSLTLGTVFVHRSASLYQGILSPMIMAWPSAATFLTGLVTITGVLLPVNVPLCYLSFAAIDRILNNSESTLGDFVMVGVIRWGLVMFLISVPLLVISSRF